MKLTEYYKAMSHDQKVAFWTITSNVFLVIFTFWMGLFVQDFIADKNANLTKELVRFDYVDRIYPTYKSITSSEVIDSLWQYTLETKIFDSNPDEKKRNLLKAGNYIYNNVDKVEEWADTMCSTLANFKYYLKPNDFDSISNNNTEILICLKVLRLCKSDSTNHMTAERFENSLKSFLCSTQFRNSGVTSINTIEASKIGGELFKVYNESEPSLQVLFKEMVANRMIKSIINNTQIIERALSYSHKDEYNFKLEPWLYLIFALFVGVFISLVVARFITSKQSIKSVSTIDYSKLEKRIRELEAFKILSEEERNRYKEIISEKEAQIAQQNETITQQSDMITLKNSIINEDIEELKRLRDSIAKLGDRSNSQ